MNSRVTDDFRDAFAKLPKHVQQQARRNYRRWKANPSHPGLQFKKVHAGEDIYSVRVGIGWRALCYLEADVFTWFWIGSHADYDKLLG